MKHITQLFEYITGMDARIGYPNEHLSSNTNINVTSPMFATGVGLVAKGFETFEKERQKTTNRNSKINTRQHSKSEKDKTGFLDKIKNWFDDNIE